MDKNIIEFIDSQKVMTLATVFDSEPYCATLFYAFLPEYGMLVFKSGAETSHIKYALKNASVAGTINAIPKSVLKLKGIQFTGIFNVLSSPEIFEAASKRYMKRFPFAGIIKKADFWGVSLNHIKMTDNSLGFGKKILWNREEELAF